MSYKYPSKTKLCKWILKGKECPRGSDCTFAHKNSELQRKKSPQQLPPPPPPPPPHQQLLPPPQPPQPPQLPPQPPPPPPPTSPQQSNPVKKTHLCVSKSNAHHALQEAIDAGFMDIYVSIIDVWADVVDDEEVL